MQNIEELLSRGVANVIPDKHSLTSLLTSGKQLNIYLGIDPTATKIHIGHAVPLRKLQKFAEMGHNVTFLIGDFTALIGDTSDKDTERPILTKEQIEENFLTYKKQAEKVLDFSKVRVLHNSDWLSKLTFTEIVKLCQNFSFGDFASRELVAKRLKDKKHVGLHEALYPVMQGYDSYFMDTDIQLGGTDQTFNMQAGRQLQKNLRNKESFVLTMDFLEGTDGRKMSKSWGNAIWLDDSPNEMYGKIMSLRDELIEQYFTLATSVSPQTCVQFANRLGSGENPRDLKKELARQIVTELHTAEEAKSAEQAFERVIQQKNLPTEIPIHKLLSKEDVISYVDLLIETGLATSRGEAKRLIEQGGVEIDNERVTDVNAETTIKDNIIIKVGKRKFVEVTTE